MPVAKDARQNGTIINHVLIFMAIRHARTNSGFGLFRPVIASAKKTATAPSQPTENVI
jgi:hypothetical protein